MTTNIEQLPASSCNFCGKGKGEVYKIVVANEVGICDECIALCNKVISDEKSKSLNLKEEFFVILEEFLLGSILDKLIPCFFCKYSGE